MPYLKRALCVVWACVGVNVLMCMASADDSATITGSLPVAAAAFTLPESRYEELSALLKEFATQNQLGFKENSLQIRGRLLHSVALDESSKTVLTSSNPAEASSYRLIAYAASESPWEPRWSSLLQAIHTKLGVDVR